MLCPAGLLSSTVSLGVYPLGIEDKIGACIAHMSALMGPHNRDYSGISSRSSDVIHSSSEVSNGQMSTSATIGSSYDDEEATDFGCKSRSESTLYSQTTEEQLD
ncbi:hypothetical protein KIN20_010880 [Parelaphostrongylus tenuis]|uniref:Uncharacterized protein n=1 Tax=Parelaphostrongylus tenuis TaxID=148309 RepID=A0AAD5QM41_PARTN|nr:hypothetical protein KIN20_010880 [Parelaphostrongylus tenuis]